MNPLRSSVSRSLRCTVIAQPFPLNFHSTRGIASTVRNATSIEMPSAHQPSIPFIPQEFQQLPRDFEYRVPQPPQLHNSQSPNPFTDLVHSLTNTLAHSPPSSPALKSNSTLRHLTSLLRAYTSNPHEWSPYAHANPSKSYTRNLVLHVPDVFNLLVLVWTPGQKSKVHDHADSHCLMKILRGRLIERRFAFPKARNGGEGKELRETERSVLREGKVGYMSDELGLHSIENPSQEDYAVSLHLYTPPNAAVRGCRVFEQESGEARHVMQGAYDSVSGVVG